ncbi:MAG: hypothetical protein V3T23_11400 [Nitrososphaerales archaeon]
MDVSDEETEREISALEHQRMKLQGNVILKLAGRTKDEAEVIEQGGDNAN